MPVVVIVNPAAGGGGAGRARRSVECARRVLADRGVAGEVVVTACRGHARELAAAAASRGARLVFAWGGDGTVNEVGSALAFTRTALGIVPAGSGNGLARTLGVARRPVRAMTEALTAAPAAVDAGRFGGRLFFNAAGVGFDGHVAACLDRPGRFSHRGLAAYLSIVARELMWYRARAYRIDGGRPRTALLVALANSPQFGNGARIAPGARVDDGQLDLVIVEERSRIRTACAVPRLFAGRLAGVAGVTIRRTGGVVIESDRPMAAHVDGEPLDVGLRVEAAVHPGALAVCVR